MAINNTLNTALSAMRVSQTALQITSQNIANVDTPGFARLQVDRRAVFLPGFGGAGVEITGIRRAADRFLQQAALSAQAAFGAERARADFLNRAQAAYGDPADDTSVFGSIDRVFSSLSALGLDPSSGLQRSRVVDDLQRAFSDIGRVSTQIGGLRSEADMRIAEGVRTLQGLLDSVSQLNVEIERTRALGGDATSAENVQSSILEQIADLVDIKVVAQPTGGVQVRTAGGELLVGSSAARLGVQTIIGDFDPGNPITITDGAGARVLDLSKSGGALAGLLRARDQDLPRLAEEAAGLATALADSLNKISNDSAGAIGSLGPLSGRDTGLAGGDRLGFTGRMQIGLLGPDGSLVDRVDVDFDAGTITLLSTGATTNIPPDAANATVADFADALNTALTGTGVPVTFADGRLSIGDSNDRIVIRQGDSDRAGRGFSQFFGLNDLIVSSKPMFFETGLQIGPGGADLGAPGFSGEFTVRITDAMGRTVRTQVITMDPASLGATFGAIDAGLAPFGSVQVENGVLKLQGASGYSIAVVNDVSRREGGSQLSFTQMFGVGLPARAERARDLSVNPAIVADPSRLPASQPDLNAELNALVLSAGDGRGAQALAAQRDAARTFPPVGGLPGQTLALGDYIAMIGASAGQAATLATASRDNAEQFMTVTVERRRSAEAVNLDEELLNLETYQQSYAAAARLIEASQELFDILLRLV